MLWTCNNVITTKRLVESVWEKTYSSTITTWLNVYIEPIQDDVWVMIDWQGAFNVFRLFTTFTNIIVWDKIIDKDNIEYKVKWVKKFSSIVWNHLECLVQSIYD